MFHDLNDTKDGKGTVNVLVATRRLESFAFEYAKTHLKKNESIIIVEENYGMSVCLVPGNFTARLCKISFRGYSSGVLLTVKIHESNDHFDGREAGLGNSRGRVDKQQSLWILQSYYIG